MREIKFRIWDGGKMMSWNQLYPHYHTLLLGMMNNGPDPEGEFALMQYTGLKDKNGKEIYEGDIVQFDTKSGNRMVYEVRWSDFKAGFKPQRLTYTNYQEISVIGNIYENPELIEK